MNAPETHTEHHDPITEGMMKTLRHLDEKYGGVPEYMQTIGLSDEQIESLRNALVE